MQRIAQNGAIKPTGLPIKSYSWSLFLTVRAGAKSNPNTTFTTYSRMSIEAFPKKPALKVY